MADDIITQIVEHPEQFGLKWSKRELNKGTGPNKVSLGMRPILVLTNVSLFISKVPAGADILVSDENGSSLRVKQQNGTRPVCRKNPAVKDETLKVICVKRVLDVRSESGPTVVTVKRSDWAMTPKAIQDQMLASGVKVELTD